MTAYVCAELRDAVCTTWVVQPDLIERINQTWGITGAQSVQISASIALFLCTCALFRKLSKIGF